MFRARLAGFTVFYRKLKVSRSREFMKLFVPLKMSTDVFVWKSVGLVVPSKVSGFFVLLKVRRTLCSDENQWNLGEVWCSDGFCEAWLVLCLFWPAFAEEKEEEEEWVCCRMLVRLVTNDNALIKADLLSLTTSRLSVASKLAGNARGGVCIMCVLYVYCVCVMCKSDASLCVWSLMVRCVFVLPAEWNTICLFVMEICCCPNLPPRNHKISSFLSIKYNVQNT